MSEAVLLNSTAAIPQLFTPSFHTPLKEVGLMVNCWNSPFHVDGVTSAMHEAVNSPVPCIYRNLRTPELERKKGFSASWEFQALSLVSKTPAKNLYLQALSKRI